MSEFLPPTRVRAILRLAQPPARRFLPGLAAGVASALSAVALLATSAWLITRAAEQPPILYLSVAIVGVRAFALGRSAFRYLDRLTSHDAAFRQLAALRVGVFERILPLAPAGLANTRRGDLLTRLVRDVDDLQDFPLRVVQPLATAGVLAVLSVAGVWLLSPLAALGLAVCLVLAGVLGTAASGSVAARLRARARSAARRPCRPGTRTGREHRRPHGLRRARCPSRRAGHCGRPAAQGDPAPVRRRRHPGRGALPVRRRRDRRRVARRLRGTLGWQPARPRLRRDRARPDGGLRGLRGRARRPRRLAPGAFECGTRCGRRAGHGPTGDPDRARR
ncbi:ABC transporter transmembrane domain-containing protein [Cryobacterium breve]|uniref:ABC transporter transmembrane domain-containing protein n=1 Tax=Cryobacterium breve TaxID=1259258 RepID=UPI0032B2C5F6